MICKKMITYLCTVSLLAMSCAVLPTTELSAKAFIRYGDINGDNTVALQDLILLNRYLAGQYLISDSNMAAADVNLNYVVDYVDGVLIAKAMSGLITLPYTS